MCLPLILIIIQLIKAQINLEVYLDHISVLHYYPSVEYWASHSPIFKSNQWFSLFVFSQIFFTVAHQTLLNNSNYKPWGAKKPPNPHTSNPSFLWFSLHIPPVLSSNYLTKLQAKFLILIPPYSVGTSTESIK